MSRTTAKRVRMRKRGRARRGHTEREGAVILVVLLIMMICTAMAVISVNATTAELREAGEERLLRQTRSASEAAMTATIGWIDILSDSSQWLSTFNRSATSPQPPPMHQFGDAPVDPVLRHMTGRFWSSAQVVTRVMPPIANADATDLVGSFGPRQSFGTNANPYAVDLTDCTVAASGSTPGAPVNAGSASPAVVQLACVITARFSLTLSANAASKAWTIGGQTYAQPLHARINESRATIITPPGSL